MHPFYPRRTLSGALADSRTPPPKFLFSAAGWVGKREKQRLSRQWRGKVSAKNPAST